MANNEDNEYKSDDEINTRQHSRLLEDVFQLDKKQYVKKPTRTEPTTHVSEFNLVKSSSNKRGNVNISDLTKVLETKKYNVVSNKVKSAQINARTLRKPLEKPQKERIKRSIGFKVTKIDLKKWDPIVIKNRVAAQMTFPLNEGGMEIYKNKKPGFQLTMKSELDRELEKLEPVVEEVKVDQTFKLSMKEILEKRQEMARLRAHQSYREAKAYKQNKIKSKKFHRVQRKEKVKNQINDFEKLQKTDPEEALKKLEELERSRVEERMSLRHRSTGQWAKNKQIRAKYDKESRQDLAQQLSISRELTQKLKMDESSDSESETILPPKVFDLSNPWVTSKSPSEVNDFISGYRKYWDEKNKTSQENKSEGKFDELVDDDDTVENLIMETNGRENVDQDLNACIEDSNDCSNNKKQVSFEEKMEQNTFLKNDTKKRKLRKKQVKLEGYEEKEGLSEEIQNDEGLKHKKVKKSNTKLSREEETKMFNSVKEDLLLNELKKKHKKKSTNHKSIIKKVTNALDVTSDEIEEEKVEDINNIKPMKEISTRNLKMDEEDLENMFEDLDKQNRNKLKDKLLNITNKTSVKTKVVEKSEKPKSKTKKNLKTNTNEDTIKKKKKNVNYLALPREKMRPDIDDELGVIEEENVVKKLKRISQFEKPTASTNTNTNKNPLDVPNIDPDKYLNAEPIQLATYLPDNVIFGDNNEEPDDAQKAYITEAFVDDDVVVDFVKDKEDIATKDLPEDINLALPGWGEWSGQNIKANKRKTKLFIRKFPKQMPRRDDNKGHLIINEHKDDKVKKHQVSEMPFPFKSVQDFEASVRAPIGDTFVPQTAFRRLIKPSIITKKGEIIKPMDDEVLVKNKFTKNNMVVKQK